MMGGSGAASLPLLRVPTIIGARVDVVIAIASCHDAQYMLELRGEGAGGGIVGRARETQ